ncbi:alpha/beta fold hydrolase [Roseiarcus sp.]|uniref:alpha/beta fold hydrolase n=1 Tax=Roseiarcus sp. TaxID=1969460 RepID=UPI003F9DC7EA
MTAIKANGITIEYEEIGPPDAPVILLIMGLGMQLIAWPQPFCEGLAARGFRVVRFDNRDAGLSTRMPPVGALASTAMMARAFLGLPVRSPYTLDDMARDTVGLMDALGIGQAHVVGASMGGMIAQIVAIEHPERVKSLTSIMSTSGDRALPGPKGNVRRALLRPRPRNEVAAVNRTMEMLRLIGGGHYPLTEAELRARVERSVRRSYRPDGFRRQLIAIQAAPGRARKLRGVRAPTLVLHGSHDPLVPLAGGEHTAANIPGARLRVVPGMGHSLPEALIPLLVDEIAGHCLKVENATQMRDAPVAGSSS